jgi:bleomycin hydrolase
MNHRSARPLWLAVSCVLLGSTASVWAREGSLSKDMLAQIQATFHMNASTRAIYNAVTNNSIKTLALNRDILRRHNEFFSDKVKTKGITNQKSSGRCWLFAGLNSLRPAVIANQKLDGFEFSQNYLAFWDKMEKANTFLQFMIDFRDRDLMDREMVMLLRGEPGDGGYFESFADLVTKYGVVPKEAMPETHSSGSTAMMNRLLYQKLRCDAVTLRKMHAEGESLERLGDAKRRMLAEVYRFLVIDLGEPPRQFTWRYKTRKNTPEGEDQGDAADHAKEGDKKTSGDGKPSTIEHDVTVEIKTDPRAFYKDFVGVQLDDFVNLFNDTVHPAGKHYRIRNSRSMYEGHDINYVNTDIAVLKKIAICSIQDGTPLVFAADVSPDQNGDYGIMARGLYDYQSLFGLNLRLTKAQRALYRSSVRNHGMVFVGVDLKEGRPIKWRVENSWGSSKGSKGYWTMYDNWFDMYVYNIIAHKKYVPKRILKIRDQPAVVLPPWDPML